MHDLDLIWYSVGHAVIWITSIFIHVGVHSRFSATDFMLRYADFPVFNLPKIEMDSWISPDAEWQILFWIQLSLLIVLQILNVVLLKVSKF